RYPAYIQNIFRAMQRYGLIVADNGSDMYISGAMDSRWNNDELNPAFRALTAADFEVVRLGWRSRQAHPLHHLDVARRALAAFDRAVHVALPLAAGMFAGKGDAADRPRQLRSPLG